MTKLFAFCSFLFLCFASAAQNLVPNPSFEEYENGCPENFHSIPTSWEWWLESPNCFSNCIEPENFLDSLGWSPLNGFGYQNPSTGNSYIGLVGFGSNSSPNFREYIGAKLIEPLEIGQTYFVEFKASLAVFSYYHMVFACSHLGVIFTNQGYDWLENPMAIPNNAQIFTNEIITDTTNWVSIEGSFTADMAYTHVGLGVFFEEEYVDTLQLFGNNSLGAYYFIDDLCVSLGSDCSSGSNISSETNEDFTINFYNDNFEINTSLSNYQFNLYDVNGRLILSKNNLNGRNSFDVILQESTGMYIVEVIKADKSRIAKKVMVVY